MSSLESFHGDRLGSFGEVLNFDFRVCTRDCFDRFASQPSVDDLLCIVAFTILANWYRSIITKITRNNAAFMPLLV